MITIFLQHKNVFSKNKIKKQIKYSLVLLGNKNNDFDLNLILYYCFISYIQGVSHYFNNQFIPILIFENLKHT